MATLLISGTGSSAEVPPLCVICGGKLNRKELWARKDATVGFEEDVVFTLKVLLQVPLELLEQLGRQFGRDVGRWISVCGKCIPGVTRAKEIYSEMQERMRFLREAIEKTEAQVRCSMELNKKKGRREEIYGAIMNVSLACRNFVTEGALKDKNHVAFAVEDMAAVTQNLVQKLSVQPMQLPVVFVQLLNLAEQATKETFTNIEQQMEEKPESSVDWLETQETEIEKETSAAGITDPLAEEEEICETSDVDTKDPLADSDSEWKPEPEDVTQMSDDVKSEMGEQTTSAGIGFKCSQCGTRWHSRNSLAQHLRRAHKLKKVSEPPKVWTCNEDGCKDKQFTIYNEYKVHVRTHKYGSPKRKCNHCDEMFHTWEQRRFHVRNKHPDAPDSAPKPTFQCPICSNYYASARCVRIHVRLKHPDAEIYIPVEKYPCTWPNCDKTLSGKDSLEIHLSRHERKPRFSCDQCPKFLYSSQDLINHKDSVHSGLTFKCDFCGRTFSCNFLLQLHRSKQHGVKRRIYRTEEPRGPSIRSSKSKKSVNLQCAKIDKKPKVIRKKPRKEKAPKDPLQCEKCGKQSKTDKALKDHLVRCQGEKKYKCEICGRQMWFHYQVKLHMLEYHPENISENEKGEFHQCQVVGCRRRFYSKSSLKAHTARDHGESGKEKRFQCSFCGKGFHTRYIFKEHELLHINKDSRPFKCTIDNCGKGFANRHNLRYHQLGTHKAQKLIQRQKEIKPRSYVDKIK